MALLRCEFFATFVTALSLLLLGILVNHVAESQEKSSCMHVQIYHPNFNLTKEMTDELEEEFGIPKVGEAPKLKECLRDDVPCQTYSCTNLYGDDLFMINGCDDYYSPELGMDCPFYVQFSVFCDELFTKEYVRSGCKHCFGSDCNKEQLKLSIGSKDECMHAQIYHPNFNPPKEMTDILKDWGIGEAQEAHRCMEFSSCQTYRCSDKYGGDLFVINGCDSWERKCLANKLNKFCNESLTKVKVVGNCTHCTTSLCNKDQLKLSTGNKTTKCYGTLRSSETYKQPKEFNVLFNKYKKRSIINCKGEKCQTFTCQDGNGNDMFVLNDCAEADGKCGNGTMDRFCEKPLKWNCKECNGTKCNDNFKLFTASTAKPTIKQINPNSTSGCLISSMCTPLLPKVKLTKRFGIGKWCDGLIKTWKMWKHNKDEIINDFIESVDKNRQVFLEDFTPVPLGNSSSVEIP
ncbi:hypothetical protein niasHT_012687 [Heterodera trifolii]|uniref:Uncharacterized protein n=1 Tax=Heterodera trifolii TaxID=157864 RepID=A0ABD2L1N0_9BILA